MPRIRPALLALPLALALGLVATAARADELRVLAAGAAQHALQRLAPGFERATGHHLRAAFDTVGAQRDRVLRGAPGQTADLVILSDAAVQQLQAAGHGHGEPGPLGQVSVALAVAAGQPVPPLSDAAQLRAALLAAPSLGYADPARGATAGTHLARTLQALGIAEALAPRITVLPFGVDVIEAVAQGRLAMGASQSSEILAHPGVRLVGPLPPPHGQRTGYAALRTSAAPAAGALLTYLRSTEAMQVFRDSGFTPGP